MKMHKQGKCVLTKKSGVKYFRELCAHPFALRYDDTEETPTYKCDKCGLYKDASGGVYHCKNGCRKDVCSSCAASGKDH